MTINPVDKILLRGKKYKGKVLPAELKLGIKVELEHTKNRKVAEKIARDHLGENSHYYSILNKCMPNH